MDFDRSVNSARAAGERNKTQSQKYGAANGVFPRGCKWRDVQIEGKEKSFWEEEAYEYWHEGLSLWTSDIPESCLLEGLSDPHRFHRSSFQLVHAPHSFGGLALTRAGSAM